MPEYDDENENENDGQPTEKTNAEYAAERKAKKAEKEAAEKADYQATKRENAFLKAGINVDDPKLKWFAKGYDGELTAEAIKKEAAEAGLMEAPPAPAETAPELDAAARVNAAAQGSAPALTGREALSQGMDEAVKNGGTPALLEYLAKEGFTIADSG